MGNSFRSQPHPAWYPESKTPVTEDLLQVGLACAIGIIAFSFILIIPGIRGYERLWATIRVMVALWVGGVLLVSNFGSWYADKICTRTQYKAHVHPVGAPQTIQAEVGLSISLRGMNITLLESNCMDDDYWDHRPFPDEEINYNERFSWSDPWQQGRLDFGIYGGRFNQEYRAAKYRGMPYPIILVAEPFTLDGEQIRWYRKFRVAGWFTHIFLWTAFSTYLISILLFIFVVSNGASFMLITGLLMILACMTYGGTIANDPELEIHFPDQTLKPTFNWAFWLTLSTGVFVVIGAVVIKVAYWRYPRQTGAFFHHSTILDAQDDESDNEDAEVYSISRNKFKRSSTRQRLTRKVERSTEKEIEEVANGCQSDDIDQPDESVGKEEVEIVVEKIKDVATCNSCQSDIDQPDESVGKEEVEIVEIVVDII